MEKCEKFFRENLTYNNELCKIKNEIKKLKLHKIIIYKY